MTSTIAGFAPDVVNAHHQFFTTTPPALAAAKRLGIPSVLTLHIAGLEDFGGWRGTVSRMYEKVLARRLVARADALVAVSHAVATAADVRPGQAIKVIPNGVDLERFRPGDPTTGDPVRFVFVGRLIANKGPDVALEAFRVVNGHKPDTRLAFVGDGPMLPMLERTVRVNGLEDVVEFLGMRDDVAEILRQSDVFVRPSHIEGMPLTILEAMATGLPVVACDVGGVHEIVVHGTTGLIVPPGSKSSVADAMLELLMDQKRRRAMGVAAHERVQGAFSWESTTAANLQLFEDLVGTGDD
jgi:glycosyltransferase involved in cell wall biosynthesis